MSTILLVGIIINTLAFGLMGLRRNELGIKIPKFFHNELLQTLITIIYFGSFAVILFAPESLVLKLAICLLMQFIINHIVWGIVMGIIAGIFFKDKTQS